MALSYKEMESLARETADAMKTFVGRELGKVRDAALERDEAMVRRIAELERRCTELEDLATRPERRHDRESA